MSGLPLAAFLDTPPLGELSQDALRAAGPQAAATLALWWPTLALCSAVLLGILIALGYALATSGRAVRSAPGDLSSLANREPGLVRAVSVGVALSTVALLGLVAASAATDRKLASLDTAGALQVHVIAHQWWWEFEYLDADVTRRFVTANELHLPVGRAVELVLDADDVIHSLWIPNLAGKRDLIPGHTQTLRLRADRAGVYRGQCAEYCGYQHANMALRVVAEEPGAFTAWADRMRAPAAAPATPLAQQGRAIFENGTCAMCHTVSGTPAAAKHAPDLTHLASRRRLAAETLENTHDLLARWISRPNALKPGVYMPDQAYSESDVQALTAYLETLK
ncbi:MAG: c-type cytochrome [Gammaproteobacteria bacterium]|nr:c-type cytochrome [Gammaproteobacteria bacterium]